LFKDESAENSITLINHRDHPLVINKVDAQSSHFTAALETTTPGQAYKLAVKVPQGLQPGRYSETIDLETNEQEHPTIRIPVNILVKDVIYATQNLVDFGDIEVAQLNAGSGSLSSQTLTVRRRSGQFEIKTITSDLPGVRVTRTPESASQSFELRVTLDPSAVHPGTLSGNIHILTGEPAVPELTIAVRGNVR
jgi:hypothetical protein